MLKALKWLGIAYLKTFIFMSVLAIFIFLCMLFKPLVVVLVGVILMGFGASALIEESVG